MIYFDQKVKIPPNTRFTKQNGQTYVHHIIETTYLPEKKYVTYKKACIGKRIDDTAFMHPNQNYTKFYGSSELKLIENTNCYSSAISVGSFSVVNKLNENLGLNNIVSEVFGKRANLILTLINYFITTGSSVIQGLKSWSFTHLNYLDIALSLGTVSNLYNRYITDEMINEFLVKWTAHMISLNKCNDIILSIDSTNMNTNSYDLSLAERGRAKKDEGLPQINLAYALDQRTGLPIYYDLYPGSIVDVTHLDNMVKKAVEYEFEHICFVLDRGYYSLKNILYMNKKKYDFLIMAKRGANFYGETLKNHSINLKDKAEYRMLNDDLYGMRIKGIISQEDNTEFYIYLYYNHLKARDAISLYDLTLKKYQEELKDTTHLDNDLKSKYGQYFNFKLGYDDRILKYSINYVTYQEYIDQAGYFIMVSNKKMTTEEAIRMYQKRDQIEKAYQALKSGLDFEKFRTGSNEVLTSKVFISFIAVISRANLVYKAREYLEDKSGATVRTLIADLDMIQAERINEVYGRRYAITKNQRDILECLNVGEEDIENSIIQLNQRLKKAK